MKKIFLILFLPALICSAQIRDLYKEQYFNKGDFEFAFFTNIGRSSIQNKITSQSTGSPESNSEFTNEGFHSHIGVAAAYYVVNNLSIEPELNIALFSENSSFSVIGNLNYTFSKPASNVSPFLKLGYGWSEYKKESYYYGRSFDAEDYMIINAGAGFKVRYSGYLFLRMEVNYRIQTSSVTEKYQDPYYSSTSKTDITITIISISIGTVILF
jgi:hypothetical protein